MEVLDMFAGWILEMIYDPIQAKYGKATAVISVVVLSIVFFGAIIVIALNFVK